MPPAVVAAGALGAGIESDGQNINRTITGMDWSGRARGAAENRAGRERTQFVRVGDAFGKLATSIADGHGAMSHIAGRLQSRAQGYEDSSFRVADDWRVTDGYNYALARAMAGDSVPMQQRVAALEAERAETARTATTVLQRLASEFDEADGRCAAQIAAHGADIGSLTPVTSALGSGVADRISKKLSEGKALSPFERRVLEEGTTLNPAQLADLRNGRAATISQGQFNFLREIAGELDGKGMADIRALGSGAQRPEIQNNLANATQLLGIPNLRTADGDHGGMAALPANIRNLLTSNLVDGDRNPLQKLVNGSQPYVAKAQEFGDLTKFLGHSDDQVRVGSDVNRGILKQASELAAAGETPQGEHLNAREFDKLLNTALNVGATDTIASHDFMTGANMDVTCADGGQYNAGIHLNGLMGQEWDGHTSGLHKLFDWVGAEAGSPDAHTATMARESASALGHYLGSPGDLDVNEEIGIRNPELAGILAKAMSPYLGDFSGMQVFGADKLEPGELENIFRSLNTDGNAAATLNSAAFKWQNQMALQYGMDTYNSSLAEYAGKLSQAMIDGNGHAVEHLSATELAERTRIYTNQMTAFGFAKDGMAFLPGGGIAGTLMQPPVANAIFGHPPEHPPVDPHAPWAGNNPQWIAQLNDPKINQFFQFAGYASTHPEVQAANPQWFDQHGAPNWKAVKDDEEWTSFMTGVSDRWADDFGRGTKRPDWTGAPDNPKPENPNAGPAKP